MEKKICVIVPMKNGREYILKCLCSLANLDYSNFEVIIVDDGIEKQLLEKIKEQYSFKILRSNSQGPSYARNLAAKHTDAEFLAFTDADCVVPPNWLRELIRGFEKHPQAISCGGSQQLPEDASKFERKVFFIMKKVGFFADYMRRTGNKNIIEVNHNPSCNVMYRRDIFLREGGFLEGLWPGEDVELDYRLRKKGYKLVFNPLCVVYHYRPQTLYSFLAMMYRYGLATGILTRKFRIFRKIHIIPAIFLLIGIIFILSIVFNFFLLFLLLMLLGIGLILIYFEKDIFILFLAGIGLFGWLGGFLKGVIF